MRGCVGCDGLRYVCLKDLESTFRNLLKGKSFILRRPVGLFSGKMIVFRYIEPKLRRGGGYLSIFADLPPDLLIVRFGRLFICKTAGIMVTCLFRCETAHPQWVGGLRN
jgi:hypothetical protein